MQTSSSGNHVKKLFAVFLIVPSSVIALRLINPEKPSPWEGVKVTVTECDACLQQLTLIEAQKFIVTGSEDCLCLNIYTPHPSRCTKLPVIFWIHGGAFEGLSSAKAFYGPEFFLDEDVVLVTMNYRVGVLGFLSTEDEVIPGNLGMKDQAAALQWVKDNIAQFGGDVDSITLLGESSGAICVHFHMLSPLTHHLFHRGILHSGSGHSLLAVSEPGVLKERSRYVAELINCPSSPSKDYLTCLQNTPSETIVNTTHRFIIWDIDPIVIWNPVIEPSTVSGAFLTKSPLNMASTKPMLAGINFAEGTLKSCSVTTGNVSAKFKQWNDEFDKITPISLVYSETAPDKDEVTKQVRAFYLGENTEQVSPNMTVEISKMYGDFWISNAVLDAVETHKGEKYLYHFNYNTTYSVCSKLYNSPLYLGACHFDELMCFFNMNMSAVNYYNPEKPDYQISVKLVELWTNFAKNSVPTASDVTWDPVTTEALEYLDISNNGYVMKTLPLVDRRMFWKRLQLRAKKTDNSLDLVD